MNKLLSSSANPNQLSLTIKGILVGLIPLALILFGGSITAGDLQETIDSFMAAITAMIGTIAAIMTAYGAIRKIGNKLKKK